LHQVKNLLFVIIESHTYLFYLRDQFMEGLCLYVCSSILEIDDFLYAFATVSIPLAFGEISRLPAAAAPGSSPGCGLFTHPSVWRSSPHLVFN
jgi:hypothetical protein